MSKEILGLISDSKFIVCVMAHSYNRSLGKVRSQIGTFWRGLSAIKVSISTCSETRVDALRTYGGKVNMWHTFGGLFLLTRGSVNDIRIFHHTPMSRWQASTYLNMSFSEGKSPGFIVHHSAFHLASAFQNDCQ